ncbi:MAG: rhodanese-like domain-containing protein [Hyphomicrobiales bacterium]
MRNRHILQDQLLAALLFAFILYAPMAFAAEKLSVRRAHEMAEADEILLVDIRTPKEWQETKIGASAVPITMHNAQFLRNLQKAVGNDKSKPVALICATGGRSSWLQKELARRGYSSIYDVAEGMLGSPAGPGWLKAGLPTKPYE